MPPLLLAGWEGIGEREGVPPLELAGQEREGIAAGGTASGCCGTGF